MGLAKEEVVDNVLGWVFLVWFCLVLCIVPIEFVAVLAGADKTTVDIILLVILCPFLLLGVNK